MGALSGRFEVENENGVWKGIQFALDKRESNMSHFLVISIVFFKSKIAQLAESMVTDNNLNIIIFAKGTISSLTSMLYLAK